MHRCCQKPEDIAADVAGNVTLNLELHVQGMDKSARVDPMSRRKVRRKLVKMNPGNEPAETWFEFVQFHLASKNTKPLIVLQMSGS